MPYVAPVAVLELVFDHPIYFEGMPEFIDTVNETSRIDGVTFNDDALQENEVQGTRYIINVVSSVSSQSPRKDISRATWLPGINYSFNGDSSVLTQAESFVEALRQHFIVLPMQLHQQWSDLNRRWL